MHYTHVTEELVLGYPKSDVWDEWGIWQMDGFPLISRKISSMSRIDFRSDTLTQPTPAMREAMFAAPLGDDVFREDPSINALEEKIATLFNMEAALFCASGTQTNQIAIRVHTVPGDEVICDENAHIYQYEGGGIAINSGAAVKLLAGDRGRIAAAQVRSAINPDDVHKPRTRLVCLENTSNRGGGSCYEMSEMQAIQAVCRENDLRFHLDGARLYNAMQAKNEKPDQYGRLFDSISICLSKSLGCPVGSVLLGKSDFIKQARRVRKVMGGGMRQAGMLAAAGIYALDHHVERLEEDHAHARAIASALKQLNYVKEIQPVETNIIIFELADGQSAPDWVARFKEKDLLAYAIAPTKIRLVLHLDINSSMVDQAVGIFQSYSL